MRLTRYQGASFVVEFASCDETPVGRHCAHQIEVEDVPRGAPSANVDPFWARLRAASSSRYGSDTGTNVTREMGELA